MLPGQQFRPLFVTSTTRDASSTDIDDYNTFVQNRAAAGHEDIREYRSGFRVVGSTASVDARDNTATTGTGVRIYWLGGAKAADNYADFYDGTWDDEDHRVESGIYQSVSSTLFTGSQDNGTASGGPLGHPSIDVSAGGTGFDGSQSLFGRSAPRTQNGSFYALSQIFQVDEGPVAVVEEESLLFNVEGLT